MIANGVCFFGCVACMMIGNCKEARQLAEQERMEEAKWKEDKEL